MHEDRCATPSEARAEYARNAGREDPGRAWVLTPWDTWEANPFYAGPPVRHPEADPEDDGECIAIDWQLGPDWDSQNNWGPF